MSHGCAHAALPLPAACGAGSILRQDGGDPFNYQDCNRGWLYKQVTCGHNHTVAVVQVGRSVAASAAAAASQHLERQLRLQP